MLSKNQIKLIRSLELKKNRKREGLFVAEGPKVVNDLLSAGFKARSIYSTQDQITEDELQRISFLQHPQQVLAVMEIPEVARQPLSEADAALPSTKLCLPQWAVLPMSGSSIPTWWRCYKEPTIRSMAPCSTDRTSMTKS